MSVFFDRFYFARYHKIPHFVMPATVLLFLGVLQVCGRTVTPPPATSPEHRGCEPGTHGCRPSTTVPPETTIPTKGPGCDVDGVWFAPGQHYDANETCWRGGIWCQEDGDYYYWDDFTCITLPPTTLPPTTPPMGCTHGGRRYAPGNHKTGQTENWCYGIICRSDGTVLAWDDWGCGNLTEPVTIFTPPASTASRRAEMETIRAIVHSICLFFCERLINTLSL